MRDITFRGRRMDNGEWVEGNLVWIKNCNNEPYQCFIISHLAYLEYGEFDDTYQVLPETVGQYTGLLDKDGKKVFEGDIVKVYDNFDYVGETLYVGKVQWDDTFLNWELKTDEKIVWQLKNLPSVLYYEVIGNVFENPELLEVK